MKIRTGFSDFMKGCIVYKCSDNFLLLRTGYSDLLKLKMFFNQALNYKTHISSPIGIKNRLNTS